MRNFDSKVMGKRIKELRIEQGLFQQDLANELGLKQSVISKYERGAVAPPYDILFKLAELFNTSIDYLVGYNDFE